jgi:hypothetical protein
MFDHVEHDYVNMGLPNLMAEVRKGRVVATGEISLSRYLVPFLDALMKKFPRWTFVVYAPWNTTNSSSFRVYEAGEELGSIAIRDHYRHGPQFVVKNARIARARQRGWETVTKDMKKAIRLVVDNFGAKTIQELLRESRDKTSHAISNVTQPIRRKFTSEWEALQDFARHYIADHWEELQPQITAFRAQKLVPVDFPASYDAYKKANRFGDAFHRADKGVIVVIKDGSYALSRKDKDPDIVTSDQLPRDVKMKLGMLKMLEDGEYVPDVGIRVADNMYFIMDDTNG